MNSRKALAAAFLAAFGTAALAQQPPSPPPSWQQGRSAEQASSPLHPFAPHLTGRAVKLHGRNNRILVQSGCCVVVSCADLHNSVSEATCVPRTLGRRCAR